jgi:hypothetical protein
MSGLGEPSFTGEASGTGNISIPANMLAAIVRAAGGTIVIDEFDLLNDKGAIKVYHYAEPRRMIIKVDEEADDAGDPGDRGGYHGFTGVH